MPSECIFLMQIFVEYAQYTVILALDKEILYDFGYDDDKVQVT